MEHDPVTGFGSRHKHNIGVQGASRPHPTRFTHITAGKEDRVRSDLCPGSDKDVGSQGRGVVDLGFGMDEGSLTLSGKRSLRHGKKLYRPGKGQVGIVADQGGLDSRGVVRAENDRGSPGRCQLVPVFGVGQKGDLPGRCVGQGVDSGDVPVFSGQGQIQF